MPARIQAHCKRNGQQVPQTPGQIARVILDSLAESYAEAIQHIETLTGQKLSQLNIVGGGSQNALLNQLAANATALTVVAGPVEATAIGNLVQQAAAAGIVAADLASQREFIAASFEIETYQPQTTPTTPKAVLL
jgi:rhamnulokinase